MFDKRHFDLRPLSQGQKYGAKQGLLLLDTGWDKGRDSYVEMRTLDFAVHHVYDEQPCRHNGSAVNKKNIIDDTVQSNKKLLNFHRNIMHLHSGLT
jgi:hypothetical protein